MASACVVTNQHSGALEIHPHHAPIRATKNGETLHVRHVLTGEGFTVELFFCHRCGAAYVNRLERQFVAQSPTATPD